MNPSLMEGTPARGEPRRRLVLIPALILAAAAFSGCAGVNAVRVQPWERAALADYTMRADRDPLGDTLSEHVYFSREAASGGKGVGGGGCGCN